MRGLASLLQLSTAPIRSACPDNEKRSRVGDHRGHQASMEYAKQRMSMRFGNARYSAKPGSLATSAAAG
jgi:hypothetical protein